MTKKSTCWSNGSGPLRSKALFSPRNKTPKLKKDSCSAPTNMKDPWTKGIRCYICSCPGRQCRSHGGQAAPTLCVELRGHWPPGCCVSHGTLREVPGRIPSLKEGIIFGEVLKKTKVESSVTSHSSAFLGNSVYIKNMGEKYLVSIKTGSPTSVPSGRGTGVVARGRYWRLRDTSRSIHSGPPGVALLSCSHMQFLCSPVGTWGKHPYAHTPSLIYRRKGCHLVDTVSITVSPCKFPSKSNWSS